MKGVLHMQQESVNPVMSQFWADSIWTALIGAPIFTATVHVHLFKAGPSNPSPLNVVADFTECDFPGYVFSTVASAAFVVPVNSPNGNARCAFLNSTFVANAVVPGGQAALGYYVTDLANANFYYAERFANPSIFALSGDFLDLGVIMPILEIGSVS